MIQSKHIGRTGNCMFQIANSIGYAMKYGYTWGVDPGRGQGEPFSNIHETFPNLPKGDMAGVRHHEHPHGICSQHRMSYDLCHYDYHEIPNIGPNVIFSGFFQSWKYFEHCKEEVKKVFELPHIEGYENYISVHIRLGDYLQYSNSFPPVTSAYVSGALRHVPSGFKCMVFSDDIPRCKNMFGDFFDGFVFEYSEGRTEKDDLSLMASCGHHIIANSSFSWWASYLGHNPDRVVICPSVKRGNWYGWESGVKKDCVDLVPPEWIQIEFR